MHNIGDARHALLELEAEVIYRSVGVLLSEYFRTRLDQSKVFMELLDYPVKVDNNNAIFTPKIRSVNM